MTIEQVAENILGRRNYDYFSYCEELEKLLSGTATRFLLAQPKEFYLDLITREKNVDRPVAFLYSLLLLSVFPDDKRLSYQTSAIALSLNYYDYSIQTLLNLKGRIDFDDILYADVLYLLGKSYRNANQLDNALENYKLSQTNYKRLGDPLNEAWMIYSLGKMYLNYLQQPFKSIDLLLEAKNKFEVLNNERRYKGISACLDELGDVYRQGLKDFKKAIVIYKEAIAFNSDPLHVYSVGLSRNYCHIGICYKYLEKLSKAEDHLKKGIEILSVIPGQEKGLGIRLTQLGNIQIDRNFDDLGFENLELGQTYNFLHNNVEYIVYNLIYQGDFYLKKKKFDDAVLKYQEATEQSSNTFYYNLSSIAYQKLSECYFHLHSFQKSKSAFISSVNSNVKHWSNIKLGRPISKKVSENVELGEMYQSLFIKLYDDYNINFKDTIANLENVYNALEAEHNKEKKNNQNVLRFGNIMAGIKHEIQNLHNDIVAVIEDIEYEKNISDENFKLVLELKTQILEKSHILSSQNLKGVISNLNTPYNLDRATLTELIYKITSDFRLKNITFENDLVLSQIKIVG